MAIPEEAKKKPKVVVPDEDEVKVGDIAPFNTRIIAGLIDSVVAVALNFVLVAILPGVIGFLGGLVALAYIITKDSLPFFGGQSIGKKVMKLRAVTAADSKPLTGDWQTGAIRNGFLIVWFIEVVVLLMREGKPEQGLRLGDDFAKTKVIVVADDMAAIVPPEDPEA